jgi:hypothetical protein
MNEQRIKDEFDRRYAEWRSAARAKSMYSKSTAYTALPEYRALIALGKEALPFLIEKLEKDEEMDFLLAEGIIDIEGWNPAEFSKTDLKERRTVVLQRAKTTGQ